MQPATNATRPKTLQDVLPNAVDGTGLPKFVLDARTMHSQFTSRGYVVNLCWMLDPDRNVADAAMVIHPERRFEDAGMWAITRRAVMDYCDEHNHPTPYAFQEAQQALPILGYDVIRAEILRLVSVVMDHVDELVQVPAAPLAVQLLLQGDPMWDVTIHAQGSPNRVIRESTI